MSGKPVSLSLNILFYQSSSPKLSWLGVYISVSAVTRFIQDFKAGGMRTVIGQSLSRAGLWLADSAYGRAP